MKNTLIAFDGLDGAGKETQTKLLTEYFEKNNIPYRYLSFPTYHKDWSRLVECYLKGEFGENPDGVNPYAASSFFACDRYISYILDWKKDYDEGKVILCNRYTTSNAVHQLSKLDESRWDGFGMAVRIRIRKAGYSQTRFVHISLRHAGHRFKAYFVPLSRRRQKNGHTRKIKTSS